MLQSIALPTSMVEAMLDHARGTLPYEACGLIGGQQGRPVCFYPARNAANSPVRYELHPEDLLRVTLEIEDTGGALWGIFHSHPQTAAYPSQTDIRLALYPDAVYLIASLADRAHPSLAAFRINGTDVRELSITHLDS